MEGIMEEINEIVEPASNDNGSVKNDNSPNKLPSDEQEIE